MRVSIIVAAARNGVIGQGSQIPWRLPDDQRFFRRMTLGHCVIMGRKTFESIGRPLPDRTNIVLSRSAADLPAPGTAREDGLRRFAELASALAWAREADFEEVFVIGGEAVYHEALPVTDRVLLTRVEADPTGDVFFPDLDPARWERTESESHPADERHDHDFAIETWLPRG